MATITVNIPDRTNELFRRTVYKKFGKGKGKLGMALDEALRRWVYKKEQKAISQRLSNNMRKGFNLNFKGYTKRSELYDRRILPN